MSEMTKRQLDDLIKLGEGFTTEFKQSGTSNRSRELCAFATATGGVVLIGVRDDGMITGVDQPRFEVLHNPVTVVCPRPAAGASHGAAKEATRQATGEVAPQALVTDAGEVTGEIPPGAWKVLVHAPGVGR